MAVELAHRFAAEHVRDPDHGAPIPAQPRDPLLDLGRQFRRVGLPGGQHHRDIRGELRDRVQQVPDPLLSGDATHEQDVRAGRVDPVGDELVDGGVRREEVGVDAVVNHLHSRRIDLVQAQHIAPSLPADGDDAVRRLERVPLDPARQVVAPAELLALPGPQRFERVQRDHQRNTTRLTDQAPAEVGVPGMAVDQVRVGAIGGHRQAALHRVPRRAQAFVPGRRPRARWVAAHLPAGLIHGLVAEGPHLDLDLAPQSPGQFGDVEAGASVDVGRVFLGQEEGLHAACRVTRQAERHLPAAYSPVVS